jgi:ferritin-like metal-binding protein YciE
MTTDSQNTIQSEFVDGLRDAHALESQAISLMSRQIERLENYPDVKARLQSHTQETEGQIQRLETILSSLNESHSALKDAALKMTANMAALTHAMADDEILKNSFANHAFENFEVASYTALIEMAQAGGFNTAVPLLRQTLDQEVAMAQWVKEQIPAVTRRYLSLRAAGAQAGR